MRFARFAAALFALACGFAAAASEEYPSKPIDVIVPFSPGGIADLLPRAISPILQRELGQPIVIFDKPGANGNTHTASAMAAKPDGYTLIETPLSTLATNPTLYGASLPYDEHKLVLVSPLATLPLFLVANSSVPANNFKEFVAWLKANPGTAYASAGVGGSNHLAGEMLRFSAGVDLLHVPYGGSGPALNAVLGGHVPWMFDSGRVIPYVKSGQLKLYAVSTAQRLPDFPEVPTIAETYPGFVASGWHGIAAPPGTPKAVVDKLNAAITKALEDPEVRKKLTAASLVPFTASPEEYTKFVAAESAKWSEIIRKSGAKVD